MEEVQKHLYVLILAGGGGTRLWPMSRESEPKQFLKLFGGKSLFSITLSRALKVTTPDKVFVSTSVKHFPAVKKLAKAIPIENIIAEPMRRDTALAHGVGALYIHKRDPDAVIVNFASDHLITPINQFVAQLKIAAKLAYESNEFVTLGIIPRFPHTGMGHIKASRSYPGNLDVKLGSQFIEKPDLARAKKFTESGQYYWNANLYVWRAKLLLDLLKKHSPKTVALFPKLGEAINTDKERSVLQLVFQMAPSISVDYAISEKVRKFVCIPAKFSWTDVGDWKEVWKNLDQDSLGNVIAGPKGRGEYVGIDSKNNLLFLDKQLIATVGLENMLVVDTPDAILICPKDDAQSVKKIVEILKDQKLLKYL